MDIFKRLVFVLLVIALLAIPASGAVQAQTGTPDDNVIELQIQEKQGLPGFMAVLFFLAVAVGITLYQNSHKKSRKKK